MLETYARVYKCLKCNNIFSSLTPLRSKGFCPKCGSPSIIQHCGNATYSFPKKIGIRLGSIQWTNLSRLAEAMNIIDYSSSTMYGKVLLDREALESWRRCMNDIMNKIKPSISIDKSHLPSRVELRVYDEDNSGVVLYDINAPKHNSNQYIEELTKMYATQNLTSYMIPTMTDRFDAMIKFYRDSR